ncbi:MAG: hypothetical protein WDZ61_00565 [Parcubacteria group bacterium]
MKTKNYSLLLVAFALILALGILHFSAIFFYFYWTLWWFDTMMHFLGGLSIGMFIIWVSSKAGFLGVGIPPRGRAMTVVLILIAVIGVGWEVFEYIFNIAKSTEDSYVLDTIADLVADMVGGFTAVIVGRKGLFYKYEPENV